VDNSCPNGFHSCRPSLCWCGGIHRQTRSKVQWAWRQIREKPALRHGHHPQPSLGRERINILHGSASASTAAEFRRHHRAVRLGQVNAARHHRRLDSPSSGQMLVDGVDITRMSEGPLARSAIKRSACLQAFQPDPDADGLRKCRGAVVRRPARRLALGPRPRGARPGRLSHRLTHRPNQLSAANSSAWPWPGP